MKIISLQAENLKRIKAVYIEPDGTMQIITGKNAAGKTSVMDAFWLAIGGGAAARETAKPVRDGEDEAMVELDLGEIVVTRTWKGDKTSLVVKSAEGAKFPSPQNMLDALMGKLSFDPLAFTRLSDRDQLAELLKIVDLDIDVDKVAAERQVSYDNRAEVGRRVKALGDVPRIDKDLPTEEVSASALITQIRAAQDSNREGDAQVRRRDSMNVRATELALEIQALKDELADAEAQVNEATTYIQKHTLVDTAALEAELEGVEETNKAIRTNNENRERAAAKAKLTAEYDEHTKSIEALDAKKAAALAKAKFPVAGLGFNEDGVTFHGIPFSDCSSAEQIKVSLAMAMALNPRLRVIRILDGSLLDKDSMKIVADMAAEKDFQVLVERVDDTSESAIVIEDGEVLA